MGLPKTYGLEIRKLAPQEVPDPDLPKCPDLNCLYGGRQPECTQKGSGSAQCPDLKVPDLRKTTVSVPLILGRSISYSGPPR